MVRWITDHEKGGVIHPEDNCTKSGELVMYVMCFKYTYACTRSTASLESYPGLPPDLVQVNVTEDKVKEIAGHLYGCAGTGRTDLVSLQHWIIRFGLASGELQLTVGDFTECLENRRPSSASYQKLMGGRLIALYKH